MRSVVFFLAFALASPAAAALPPGTVVALWVTSPPTHGEIPAGMPARFVLLEDGRIFVGGTSEIGSARLPKEGKAIEKQVSRVRKLPGLQSAIAFGGGEPHYRLVLAKGQEVLASGDPARAPQALRPLADLLATLSGFTHAALRPYAAESFLLSVDDRALVGGCRDWRFPTPLADARTRPILLPAVSVSGWPTGGYPASVCGEGDRNYTVTLRPLLPGETP